MIVPQALKRPFFSCVAPRNTAAKAGSRYGLPAVGAPDPMFEASTMPVTPARVAEAIRQPNCEPLGAHRRQPGGVAVEAGGVDAPAGGGVLLQVPDAEGHDEGVEDGQREVPAATGSGRCPGTTPASSGPVTFRLAGAPRTRAWIEEAGGQRADQRVDLEHARRRRR